MPEASTGSAKHNTFKQAASTKPGAFQDVKVLILQK
jgi:hypothetical protein